MPPKFRYSFVDRTYANTNFVQHEQESFPLDGSRRDRVRFGSLGAKQAVQTRAAGRLAYSHRQRHLHGGYKRSAFAEWESSPATQSSVKRGRGLR